MKGRIQDPEGTQRSKPLVVNGCEGGCGVAGSSTVAGTSTWQHGGEAGSCIDPLDDQKPHEPKGMRREEEANTTVQVDATRQGYKCQPRPPHMDLESYTMQRGSEARTKELSKVMKHVTVSTAKTHVAMQSSHQSRVAIDPCSYRPSTEFNTMAANP